MNERYNRNGYTPRLGAMKYDEAKSSRLRQQQLIIKDWMKKKKSTAYNVGEEEANEHHKIHYSV